MKLNELAPRYFVSSLSGHPIGITFGCPHCHETGQRLAIAIHIDGTGIDPDPLNPQQFPTDERIWTVAGGDSFDNLSLSPSIDASASGHWHGYITGGEIR